MFKKKEPKNETYLAAELALARVRPPGHAAWIATDLCSIGRAYTNVSERLCNGFKNCSGEWNEKATERAEKRRDMLLREAQKLVSDFPRVRVEARSLYLVSVTKDRQVYRETVLI